MPYSVNVSPGPGHDHTVADAYGVYRPVDLRRRRAVAELGLDPARPGGLVVGELDPAAIARGARLLEGGVVLDALLLDLVERR